MQVPHLLAFDGKTQELCNFCLRSPGLCLLRDVVGCTALHWAAAGGQVSAIRVLILLGGSPWMIDLQGSTPLHVAAKYGHLDACLELLDASGLQMLHVLDNANKTPGECAADHKHWKVFEELERLYDVFLSRHPGAGEEHAMSHSGGDSEEDAGDTGDEREEEGPADESTAAQREPFRTANGSGEDEHTGRARGMPPAGPQPALNKLTQEQRQARLFSLSELPPYRERTLQPGFSYRRLPGVFCVAWIATVAVSLHGVRSEPCLPPMGPHASQLLSACLQSIPFVLMCFTAASMSDCGTYSNSQLERFKLIPSAPPHASGGGAASHGCAAGEGKEGGRLPSVMEEEGRVSPGAGADVTDDCVTEDDEADVSELEVAEGADAKESDPCEDPIGGGSNSAGAGLEASQDRGALLEVLERGEWRRICVAHRAVLPPSAGYDRTTGLVVEGYTSYVPLISNVVGAGNQLTHGAAYFFLLCISCVGVALAAPRVYALADFNSLTAASASRVYMANAAMLVSALLCLSPLLTAAIRVAEQLWLLRCSLRAEQRQKSD